MTPQTLERLPAALRDLKFKRPDRKAEIVRIIHEEINEGLADVVSDMFLAGWSIDDVREVLFEAGREAGKL